MKRKTSRASALHTAFDIQSKITKTDENNNNNNKKTRNNKLTFNSHPPKKQCRTYLSTEIYEERIKT